MNDFRKLQEGLNRFLNEEPGDNEKFTKMSKLLERISKNALEGARKAGSSNSGIMRKRSDIESAISTALKTIARDLEALQRF